MAAGYRIIINYLLSFPQSVTYDHISLLSPLKLLQGNVRIFKFKDLMN